MITRQRDLRSIRNDNYIPNRFFREQLEMGIAGNSDALTSIQDQCEEVYNKVRISIFDVQSVVDSIEGNQSTYTDFRTTPNRDEEPLISSLVMTNNLVPTVAGTDDTNPIVLD